MSSGDETAIKNRPNVETLQANW